MTRADTKLRSGTAGLELPAPIRAAIKAAADKKATDIIVLDLRDSDAFTDYFVICSGQNPRNVVAISDAVEQALKDAGRRPAHIEGYERAEWVLIDCFEFVIHVFTPHTREFYGLERLWGRAGRIEIDDRDAAP